MNLGSSSLIKNISSKLHASRSQTVRTRFCSITHSLDFAVAFGTGRGQILLKTIFAVELALLLHEPEILQGALAGGSVAGEVLRTPDFAQGCDERSPNKPEICRVALMQTLLSLLVFLTITQLAGRKGVKGAKKYASVLKKPSPGAVFYLVISTLQIQQIGAVFSSVSLWLFSFTRRKTVSENSSALAKVK